MWGNMGIAPQRTLRAAATCRGIGLHCGIPVTMTMRPALPDSGIVFRRTDAGAEIRAAWTSTSESALSTVLSNGEGIQIGTIEHLMAAFAGGGVGARRLARQCGRGQRQSRSEPWRAALRR